MNRICMLSVAATLTLPASAVASVELVSPTNGEEAESDLR